MHTFKFYFFKNYEMIMLKLTKLMVIQIINIYYQYSDKFHELQEFF